MNPRDVITKVILDHTGRGANESICADRVDRAAVADELLSRYVFIEQACLPSVSERESESDTYLVDGTNVVFTSTGNALDWCLRDIAVWQYLERKESARNCRREELLREFMPEAERANNLPTWDDLNTTFQRAIDRVIELEGKS